MDGTVHVSQPRGFGGQHFIVIQQLIGAVRIYRTSSAHVAQACRADWRRRNYQRFRGEIRVFQEHQ
jgi:hypothetical protein